MLIYIFLMAALAVFFHRESKKLIDGNSRLLAEYCTDEASARMALRLLRLTFLGALSSAVLMAVCFLITKLTDTMPKPLAALSIAVYSIDLIYLLLKLKDM